jgi:hypothetical protein
VCVVTQFTTFQFSWAPLWKPEIFFQYIFFHSPTDGLRIAIGRFTPSSWIKSSVTAFVKRYALGQFPINLNKNKIEGISEFLKLILILHILFLKLNLWLTAPKGATLVNYTSATDWQMAAWRDNVISITPSSLIYFTKYKFS